MCAISQCNEFTFFGRQSFCVAFCMNSLTGNSRVITHHWCHLVTHISLFISCVDQFHLKHIKRSTHVRDDIKSCEQANLNKFRTGIFSQLLISSLIANCVGLQVHVSYYNIWGKTDVTIQVCLLSPAGEKDPTHHGVRFLSKKPLNIDMTIDLWWIEITLECSSIPINHTGDFHHYIVQLYLGEQLCLLLIQNISNKPWHQNLRQSELSLEFPG